MRRLLPLLALLGASCGEANYATFNHFAQGTTYRIVVADPPADMAEKIEAVFDEIDLTFSVFNPTSLVSRVNRNETTEVSPLFEECFALAKRVHEATGGYFDSTVSPLVNAWGFGPGGEQAEPNIDSLMEFVGMGKVRIDSSHLIIKDDGRVQMNFSSIAKGLTVDKLAEMIESEGVTHYMVWVGGEARVRGVNARGRAWRLGIDEPTFGPVSGEYVAAVDFPGELRAIATSGNYRNWFVDESGRTRAHTIDPLTGFPALGEILSVTIVAGECALADAWATGVMASGSLERARRVLSGAPAGLEYLIIYGEGRTESSPGFPIAK